MMTAFVPVRLAPKQRHTISFEAPELPTSMQPYLFFRARADDRTVSGFMHWAMRLELNGQPLDVRRIVNRPMRSTTMSGTQFAAFTPLGEQPLHRTNWHSPGGTLWLIRSPDFTSADTHPVFRYKDGTPHCDYEFALAGLLRDGLNTVTFISQAGERGDAPLPIVVGDFELRIKATPIISPALPPNGELPVVEPQLTFPRTYTDLQSHAAAVALTVGGERFEICSRFSAPDGNWHEGSNHHFHHQRQVIEHDEWIEVRDTFTNLSSGNLPVMQQHDGLVDHAEHIWLCGIETPGKSATRIWGENPTAYATTRKVGVGLLALNDEFRVHMQVSCQPQGLIRLEDPYLMIPPGASYTAEWAIVPTPRPDFWAFINASRRLMDANFTIDLLFAFLPPSDTLVSWTDDQIRQFIEYRSANFLTQHLRGVSTQAEAPHGIAFQNISHNQCGAALERVKRLELERPAQVAVYYCCFIDSSDDVEARFPKATYRDLNGDTFDYALMGPKRTMIVARLDNGYGEHSARNIDIILDKIGADGIYWDEFTYSKTLFTYGPLDGCSADIDPKTFQLLRPKGAISLLSDEYRSFHIQRIRTRGCQVYGNGAPVTRTLARLKPISFVETGHPEYIRSGLLHTPIALGDHRREVEELDAYKTMLWALDNGSIYAWYSPHIRLTHQTLTKYMYPITPIELREGCVIGRERILTNRSGLFGWGDASIFEAHVFDAHGREVDDFPVPRVENDGKAYAEVRIIPGYSCALVRQGM